MSMSRNLGGTTGMQAYIRPFADECMLFYFCDRIGGIENGRVNF